MLISKCWKILKRKIGKNIILLHLENPKLSIIEIWQILKDFPGGIFRQAQILELGGVIFSILAFFIPVEQNYNSFVAFFCKNFWYVLITLCGRLQFYLAQLWRINENFLFAITISRLELKCIFFLFCIKWKLLWRKLCFWKENSYHRRLTSWIFLLNSLKIHSFNRKSMCTASSMYYVLQKWMHVFP